MPASSAANRQDYRFSQFTEIPGNILPVSARIAAVKAVVCGLISLRYKRDTSTAFRGVIIGNRTLLHTLKSDKMKLY